jgi:6-phosphogluconolactonase (cycloisomerase 2 family)
MEMNERMSKRFWLLGLVGLVLVGLLVACGSKYDSSSNGLLLVGSQGSSAIETFSFTLNNGHVSAIANSPNDTGSETCLLNGSPASMVVNPSGVYAFVIFNKSGLCPNATQFGIATFKVNSDGTVSQTGNILVDPNPTSLAMDPAGKYLFVAEGDSSIAITNATQEATACTQTLTQNGVCVYAIGSDGGLTAVPSTFNLPLAPRTPNFVALAPTPTVFPGIGINGVQNAVCSVANPPTSQFLYAVDTVNYLVWEFTVDQSTGALGNPGVSGQVASFGTDPVPLGIAVDPCDRFAYVSDSLTNKVSAYTICSTVVLPTCPVADGSLLAVAGSPFALTGSVSQPGPLVVDPFGNNVYVVGTASNTLSALKISPVSGGLAPLSVATVATGQRPTSIAIRGDDNWMFVSNFSSASVSQYSITPATGALTAEAPIDTDNLPFGVAVK